MERVTLVMPKSMHGDFDHPFPPLSLLYLAPPLQHQGYQVEIIDGAVLSEEDYNNAIENINGDYVGISVTFFHMNELSRILPTIQQQGKPVIVGGPGVPSITNKPSFLRETGIDYLIEGEAEQSFPALLHVIDDKKAAKGVPGVRMIADGIYHANPQLPRVDVNEFPIPSRDLINLATYRTWGNYTSVITSRGCPYSCSFCDLSVAGHKVRYRNLENVIEELVLLEGLGLDDVFIFDDLFTVNKKRVKSFSELIKAEGIKLTWGGNARINLITDQLCEDIRASNGTRLFMGVESGSQRILEKYDKHITTEQTRDAFRTCKEHDIKPCAYVMIGHPDETLEDVKMTAELVHDIAPDYMDLSVLTPIPGTHLYRQHEQQIDKKVLYELDTRQQRSAFKSLHFDLSEGLALIREAFKSK